MPTDIQPRPNPTPRGGPVVEEFSFLGAPVQPADRTARLQLPLLSPAPRLDVLGVQVTSTDYDRATEAIIRAAQVQRPFAVTTLGVDGLLAALFDPEQKFRVNSLELVTPGGRHLRWAMNLLHLAPVREQITGPALTLAICERAGLEGLPIYLYGSRRKALAALTRNLEAVCPGLRVAGSRPALNRGMTEEERWEIVRDIRESGARLLFLGLESPEREVWIFEMRKFLPMPMLAVGGALELHAGVRKQPPAWMKEHGLAWLHRFWQAPLAQTRRYLWQNPLFLGLITLQRLGLAPRAARRAHSTPPKDEQRFG